MLVITEHKMNQIPYTHYRLKNELEHQSFMIVLYHGWGSSTHNMRFLASTLALWGYHVITPEILYHDSRNPLANHFKKDIQEECFWETIIKSVEEVKELTAYLKERYTEKLILFGSSMGGMITTGAFVKDHHIKGLITINSSGNWTACEHYFQSVGYRSSNLEEEIEYLDPINFTDRLQNRPVLLLNGTDDKVVPPESQRDFYETAVKHYFDKNLIIFNEYQGVQHTTTLQMIEEAIGWLNSNFCSSASSRLHV